MWLTLATGIVIEDSFKSPVFIALQGIGVGHPLGRMMVGRSTVFVRELDPSS
jgi:hypothetical protein